MLINLANQVMNLSRVIHFKYNEEERVNEFDEGSNEGFK